MRPRARRAQDVWLEQADAAALAEGEEVTLMDWGNAVIRARSRRPLPLSRPCSAPLLRRSLMFQGSLRELERGRDVLVW